MYTRLCADRLEHLARQVGKTTLAWQSFPAFSYLDLEDTVTRKLFAEDPRFQIDARSGTGLILDEAQRLPALFDALRGAIDANRERMGRFVILGSAQPAL